MARPGHDIIVIGASAGGVEALSRLVRALPRDLPASIFVVLHLTKNYRSQLPEILTRQGTLPAVPAMDNALFERGRIYVAPPDKHLLLERNRIRVVHGPKENRHRPAIDPLFRSAGYALGPRVCAVVLSGALDDGAAGLWAVKSTGGTTVVQDPDEAAFSGMPTSALLYSSVDHVLPLAEIAPLLADLAREPAPGEGPIPATLGDEVPMAANKNQDMNHLDRIGDLSAFTCPACGGALWELKEGDILRYRCHVGHAYNGESLMEDQADRVEHDVYAALRALREQVEIVRRVGDQIGNGNAETKRLYGARAAELESAAESLKQLLQSGKT